MRNPIAFLLVAVAAGCMQGSGSPSQPQPPQQQPGSPPTGMTAFQAGIYLAEDPWRFKAGQPIDRFNFAHLDDLWVRVTVPAMHGLSTLHLEFKNPAGEVVYEDQVPFTTDPTQKTTMMPIGETFILQGTPVPGGYALDRRVPIMGTVFTRYAADGDWEVSAIVDGFMSKLSVPMHVLMIR